ncbi:xanthine dehydrogenase family protein molybdopterin-binding subunit [Lutispora saccharofermentans]|uniref:Molybdopterin-dependent oxidoreductase n=1 Tax=Lutispora saccharofermentans TaxID=3024236 RepID=A0ABT1NC59_9FIRM|nr:molybdopterin cofactor-binding domain-containing protein [Lutispora saccharofermentans]MCQ1528853.1 molybdopterin-dependent oxidoreductase [Lutispora saccharofermentans]
MRVNNFNIVGKRQEKIEAKMKATGKMRFTGDLRFPDMLHCRILRSPYAHAVVKSIDVSGAFEVEGVVDVITYDDVPKILSMHQFLHVPEIMFHDSYILEKHVRHVGDRVAAVAATSVEAAEEALNRIKVEYEVLPVAATAEDALKPDACQIHEEAKKGDKYIELKGNILDSTDVSIGDTEKGFAESEYIIEREYRTSKPNPAPLERTCVICVPRDDGRLDVYATSQGIHAMRMNMSHSLGISASKLNCHRMYLGGAFGAHIHTGFIENICALLAMRTGKPVRGEKTREEMFLSCGRHPMIIKVKAGFKKDGTMLALHADVTDDTGAYAFSGSSKMSLAAGTCLSMYRCPNMRITGVSVYTNTPPLSAMRGAGNPQGNWAVETMMDEAAMELGIDPVELRFKNNVDVGDLFYGQGPAVKSTIRSCGTSELLNKSTEIMDWYDRNNMNHVPYPDKPWIRRGIGMARGFHTSGCGSEKPNAFIIDHSAAFMKMNEDGTAQIMNSAADCGSGCLSSHAALAAEIIGLKYEDVMVNQGDTDTTPFDGATHASRGLYGSGQPIVKCAEELHAKLLEWGARLFQCGPEDLEIKDSKIYIHNKPEDSRPVADVVRAAHFKGWGVAASNASVRPNACPPHFVTIFVEIEVNTLTGMVKVVRALSGVDAGTIINANNVEGQVTGGMHMGLGFALMEDTLFDKGTGKLLTPNFSKYHLLTSMDMPEVEMIFAGTYEPTGPLGAKAIGEGVTNPVAAAVGNAIYNACGIRIRDLPCTPEKIIKALKEKNEA